MRKLAFITLIVIFSSIYYFSAIKNENSLAFQIKQEVSSVVAGLKPASSQISKQESLPQNESLADAQTEFGVDLGVMDEPQLNDWLRSEAVSMNMTNNDTVQVEVKLRASAKTLKPEQIKILSLKVSDTNAPANERILAAYMLTLNPTEASVEAQFDQAKEPLHDFGPPHPHSEAELKRTQELALKYMEVDRLAELAKTDANVRDKLKLLVTTAGSEEVRNYVTRKIKELSL